MHKLYKKNHLITSSIIQIPQPAQSLKHFRSQTYTIQKVEKTNPDSSLSPMVSVRLSVTPEYTIQRHSPIPIPMNIG